MMVEDIVTELGGTKKTLSGWLALCPIHEADGAQNKPWLATDEKDGKILVHCFAGCDQRDVIAALKARALWPSDNASLNGVALKAVPRRTERNKTPLTLANFADAKGFTP